MTKHRREIFLKIAQKSDMNENGKPKKEIFVLVGHGARSDLNDLYQTKELTSAAKYVQHKMKYADAFGVTAREDWPELMPDAVNSAADKIEESINMHNADHAVLVPAAGSGSGFDAVKQELDNRGISYVETEGTLPIGAKQFTRWALKNIIGSTVFILMEKPSREYHNLYSGGMTYFYILFGKSIIPQQQKKSYSENLMKAKETLLSDFDNVFLIKSLLSLEIMIYPNISYRKVMEGITHILRTGCQWKV